MSQLMARLQHYGRHCEEHLSRVRLSHSIALAAVQADDGTWGRRYGDVAAKSFGADPVAVQPQKLCRGLNEVHLIALKANFELYLNRVATTLWRFGFDRAAARSKREVRVPPRYLAQLLAADAATVAGTREAIITRIVPSHGLLGLLVHIDDAADIHLSDMLKRSDTSQWSQIVVAFEVRHLVEHRDGEPDNGFRERVGRHWRASTWGGRRDLESKEKVP